MSDAEHTPWLDEDEGDQLIRRAIASEKKLPKADTLARFLGLTYADRTRLGICTIGAIDATKAQRKALHKEKWRKLDKARQEANRRAAGAKPHALSASRTRPWEAFGIKRRQWERRGKPLPPKPDDANSSDLIGRSPILDELASSSRKPRRPARSKPLRTKPVAPRKRLVRKRAGETAIAFSSASHHTDNISLALVGSTPIVVITNLKAVMATRRLATATIPCVSTNLYQPNGAYP